MEFGAQSIERVLDQMASETVAPASGSAIATTGAMGAALCEMTCVHTLDNEPAEAPMDLRDPRDRLRNTRGELLALAGEDARVIERVFSPSSPDPTSADTERILEVPVSIAEAGVQVIEIGGTLVDEIDRAVVADAKTGVILANAAFEGALWIVTDNLGQVSDASVVARTEERVGTLVEARDSLAEELSEPLLSHRSGSSEF